MNETTSKPMYRFLVLLTICSTMGLQAWQTLFDNFAVHVAGLEGRHVGAIQSIREIPGFLTLLAVYVMLLIREHRLSALSVLILGLGLAATGFFPSFAGLALTTMVMSFGFHYYETTNQSLTLQYFDKTASPWVFGRLRSAAAASNVAVGLVILALASFLEYRSIYLIIGGAIAAVGLWACRQNPEDLSLPPQRKRMILRRRYWLYYLLSFLAGARRQIFVAFAVFLMVQRFGFSVREITILFVVNNLVNYFLSPAIGRWIVRYGERKVLSLEYVAMAMIFTAYALTASKAVVAALYILDHVFFNFAIAIRTYFQKVGDPRDIAPSMAVGFTINHIAAVVLPVLGGLVWMVDYRLVFFAAVFLALCSLAAAQFIRLPDEEPAPAPAAPRA